MAGVQPNWYRYLVSLGEELHAQSTRVRDLIGESHWLTDGHHKEYLLTELLRRHLPSGVVASRGFVISPSDSDIRSKEQDVLVVDTQREAPVFQGDQLVIAFPRSVLATISVKTTLDSTTVADTVEGLNSVRRTAVDQTGAREIWCAGYFFEVGSAVANQPTSVYDHFVKAVAAHPVRTPVLPDPHPIPLGPDLLCSAKDLAYRFDHGHSSDSSTTVPPRIMGFDCNGLATALFLANLLAHIANARGLPHTDFGDFANHVELAGLDEPYRDVAEPS